MKYLSDLAFVITAGLLGAGGLILFVKALSQ